VQARLDIKRAFRIEHPFESLRYYPGCRQWYTETGDDKTGIAARAAGAYVSFLHHRDSFSQFIEI